MKMELSVEQEISSGLLLQYPIREVPLRYAAPSTIRVRLFIGEKKSIPREFLFKEDFCTS